MERKMIWPWGLLLLVMVVCCAKNAVSSQIHPASHNKKKNKSFCQLHLPFSYLTIVLGYTTKHTLQMPIIQQ
jgi:hypothetical protein